MRSPLHHLGALRERVTPRSTWGRRLAKVAAVTVLIFVVASVALVLFVRSTSGRDFIARKIETLLSDQIAGSMTIGHIDRISPDHVVARNIRFLSPEGQLVVHARWADIDFRMFDLLRGHVATSRARVRGGAVYLDTDAQGDLGLDMAFRGSGSGSGALTVDFDQLRVTGILLRARMSGAPNARITRVSGDVRVWTETAGAKAQLLVSRLTGRVGIDSPIPIRMIVERGGFRYDGARIGRTHLDVHGTMGGSPVRLDVTVETDEEEPLVVAELTVDGVSGWIGSAPLITQATLAELFSPGFDLRVQTGD
jgi:uncharacterized protein involved in outer membrane biogenesis